MRMVEGNRLAVSVSDDGCGIPEDAREHLFEPLFRLYEKTEGENHAGLGLAIAKRCIDLQGGDIRIESTVDAGTSFIFRLPVYQVDSNLVAAQ